MQVGLVTHHGHWERCECAGQDSLVTGEVLLVSDWVGSIDQA